jgi:DNA-binding NarL/FixJ family response regulator
MLIKIALIEDHELYATTLKLFLNAQKGFEVVWNSANVDEVNQMQLKFPADLILLDYTLPKINGSDLAKEIKKYSPETKIIMLTAHDDEEAFIGSMRSGADAFCTKEISNEQLVEVIKMVDQGAVWFDPAVAIYIKKLVSSSSAITNVHNYHLSERELEVLDLLTQGKSNKEIASLLFITTHTVKAHVCSIIQKLSVTDRTSASIKALKMGIVK